MSDRTPALPRGLVAIDPAGLPTEEAAVVVVGSGVAGLTLALELPAEIGVLLVTKGPLDDGATRYAQGGIAAVLPGPAAGTWNGNGNGQARGQGQGVDSVGAHLRDTLAAGAGLVDPVAAGVLVSEAAPAISTLRRHGARFDTEDGHATGDGLGGGRLALAREGGHSSARILHAGGDATGAEIEGALVAAVRAAPNVRVAEHAFLVDLLTDRDGAVIGALLLVRAGPRGPAGGRLVAVRAGAVVLASGGAGRLFTETTNPAAATGDGIAAALRAGATVADLEFVQFHPTALHVDGDPRLLLTEAIRGEGAVLRDRDGEPVMAGVHPMADLAPRDVVTRAMAARMAALGTDHLLLDATRLGAATVERRFPTIVAACRAAGLDPVTTPLPVSPAAHYLMGGIRTDLDGRASIPGLFAVGEAACTGVHGANRLASNSLLEGTVFAARAARAIAGDRRRWRPCVGPRRAEPITAAPPSGPGRAGRCAAASDRAGLRATMTRDVGVLRSGAGLARAVGTLAGHTTRAPGTTRAAMETANLAQLGLVVAVLAGRREESRGAHRREDAPATSARWRLRQVASRGPDGTLAVGTVPVQGTAAGSAEGSVRPRDARRRAREGIPGLWTAEEPGQGDVTLSAVGGSADDHGA